MYELLILVVLGFFVYRVLIVDERVKEGLPSKINLTVNRLWHVVHKGMRENRLLRAEKALLTILKIDEKNASAYNRLGIIYAKQKQYKDAIDCFQIACSIEASASALHNLGLIYYETENYQKAVAAFEDAIEVEEEENASRYLALAKAKEHLEDYKSVIAHLEKAISLEPRKEYYHYLEKVLRARGWGDQADLIADKMGKVVDKKTAKTKFRLNRFRKVV